MTSRAASLVWRVTYARYIMASGVSLCSDMAVFMLLLNLGTGAVQAAALGYCAGLVVHWLMSSRLVFARQTLFLSRRRKQKALFVLSALLGLAITSLIVGLGNHFGLNPVLAKLCAIVVSFQTTYLLRRTVVFA